MIELFSGWLVDMCNNIIITFWKSTIYRNGFFHAGILRAFDSVDIMMTCWGVQTRKIKNCLEVR